MNNNVQVGIPINQNINSIRSESNIISTIVDYTVLIYGIYYLTYYKDELAPCSVFYKWCCCKLALIMFVKILDYIKRYKNIKNDEQLMYYISIILHVYGCYIWFLTPSQSCSVVLNVYVEFYWFYTFWILLFFIPMFIACILYAVSFLCMIKNGIYK